MARQPTILFEALGNIIYDKSLETYRAHVENEESWKTFSKFMTLRYLTMCYDEAGRQLVIDNFATLERMPDKQLYYWLLRNFPRQRSRFIKYIK